MSADGEIEFVNRRYNGYPLLYLRFCGDERYLICINPTGKKQSVRYKVEDFEIVMSNDDIHIDGEEMELEATSYAIIKLERKE